MVNFCRTPHTIIRPFLREKSTPGKCFSLFFPSLRYGKLTSIYTDLSCESIHHIECANHYIMMQHFSTFGNVNYTLHCAVISTVSDYFVQVTEGSAILRSPGRSRIAYLLHALLNVRSSPSNELVVKHPDDYPHSFTFTCRPDRTISPMSSFCLHHHLSRAP